MNDEEYGIVREKLARLVDLVAPPHTSQARALAYAVREALRDLYRSVRVPQSDSHIKESK